MTYHYKRGSLCAPLPITEKLKTPHREVRNPSPRGRERIAERVATTLRTVLALATAC